MGCARSQDREGKMILRRFLLAAGLLAALASPVAACGFIDACGYQATFREEAAASKILLFGRLENGRDSKERGSTDFVVLKVIEGGSILGDKKVVPLSQYFPIDDPKNPPHYLYFGKVTKGVPDFIKLVRCSPVMGDYVAGIRAFDGKDRVKLMRYCFAYLEHEDSAIAADAFREFGKSTDADVRKAGRDLSADKLRRWLADERTEEHRLRVYAFLLSQCGMKGDAALLRKVLDRLVKRKDVPNLDGVLTAYVLLNPNEGWEYTTRALKDPARHIVVRLSALSAARYFRTTHPGVIAEKDISAAVRPVLDQADLADFAIDDLRQWKCWTFTRQILELPSKKGFDAAYLHRAILRYALQCPGTEAARFVERLRKADASLVEEVEEVLKLQDEAVSVP
jgi:hypothetical protein